MKIRKLGHEGLEVSALGLGTMMMPNCKVLLRVSDCLGVTESGQAG